MDNSHNISDLKTWASTTWYEAEMGLHTQEIAERYGVTVAKARRLARAAGLSPGLYVRDGESICPGEHGWPRNGHKPGWWAIWEFSELV